MWPTLETSLTAQWISKTGFISKMNSLSANKMNAKNGFQGFLGDAAVKNPSADKESIGRCRGHGSIPSPVRSHMLGAYEPQLLIPRAPKAKPVCHNYWSYTLEPRNRNYWALPSQLLKPACPGARAQQQEKPATQWETRQQRRPSTANKQIKFFEKVSLITKIKYLRTVN